MEDEMKPILLIFAVLLAGLAPTLPLWAQESPTPQQITAIKYTTLLTAALIAGEALALEIGMHLPANRGNGWLHPRNEIMMATDILTGVALIVLTFTQPEFYRTPAFYILTGLNIVTHVFRDVEYFAPLADPYCGNVPLLVINNVKLAGLIAAGSLGLNLSIRF